MSLARSLQTPEQQAGVTPEQVFPQVPQLLGSLWVSTQVVPQSVRPLPAGAAGPHA
jgi:hypothetical protein